MIKPTQWAGLVVLICAVYIMCSYNNSLKGKMSCKTFLLLVFCGLMNACSSFSQKLFAKGDGNVAVFFKEKLNIKAVTGIILAFAALVIINVL